MQKKTDNFVEKKPNIRRPKFPVIIQTKKGYDVEISDFSFSNISTFPAALAILASLYVNFNLQLMSEVACTVSFLIKVVCKIPLKENLNGLHNKKKFGINIGPVLTAEDLFYGTQENPSKPK